MGYFNKKLSFAFRALIALTISLIIISFPFHSIESFFYDMRFRLSPQSFKSPHIELIGIDRFTMQDFKGEPSLEQHNNMLIKLLKSEPLAIYYVMDPKKMEGTREDRLQFASILKRFKNHILYMKEIPNNGEESKTILGEDFPGLKYSPGYLSTDFQHFAEDSVARRGLVFAQGYVYSQVKAAHLINPVENLKDYRGAFEFSSANSTGTPSIQINVNYQPTTTFPIHGFNDIYNDRLDLSFFKNKIVLIGYDRMNDYKEYVKTVYINKNFAMSELEAQANIISTLVHNNGIIKTPNILNAIATILFSLVVTFVVLRLSPTRGLLVILSITLGYSLLSWALFSVFGVAIGMAQPLLAIFVCYYLFIPYRLIQENKRFWELTQKNKLLTQVEELKNNFLSMMSHDLKTPLARIQGMADVALSKGNLDPEQKNALTTIRRSAEELTEFITSILDLTRVESQQIKLHLQSKDVNQILNDCIQKLDYLAKEKNIEIVKELETLFSIKVDPDLLKQVFGNLIENAIKYSPEGSKVLITTEELNGQIIVQVADQGLGISDHEIKNIFTKFYRTKDVKNSPIKGSGLGLYLAKYFVELHKGDISVESLPKEGSTFTVQLPMDL